MLSRMQVNKVAARSLRSASMSTCPMTEQFPTGFTVQPRSPVGPAYSFNKQSNGVKTAISSQPSATATIKIGVRGGSSQENLNEKGAAHLLACGAFDGNAHKNGVAVMRAFEDIGATVSAQASREEITYTIAVGSEHVSEALELAIDNVKAPIARDYMIEHARYRAAVQYAQFKANPCQQVSELLHEASFGENTPLGGSLFASSLDGLLASDVLHFRNTHFSAENLCVAVHGANSTAAAQIEAQTSTGFASGTAAVFGAGFTGGEMRVRESIGGATRASLAFAAPAGKAGKAHEVLRSILNAKVGSTSPPHVHSMVHHYQSRGEWTNTFFNAYQGTGMFGVNFTGDAKYVNVGLECFVTELKTIAANCSSEDLAAAKNRLHLESKLSAEGSSGASRLYATLANGNGFSSPFAESDYSAVTKEEVAAAAKAALKSTPGYAVFGATYQVPFLTGVTKLMA